LLAGLGFVEATKHGFEKIANLLSSIAERTRLAAESVVAAPEAMALLDAFRHKYTMEIERMLHAGVVHPQESESAGMIATVPSDPAGGEFGDNVELF
jgi:hypothetical protein